MASRRAIKAINWGALAERISESDRASFAALKAKSDQYFRRVQDNPETIPKIDWAFYKSKIGLAGFVDKFQKEYESLQITYPEDKYTSIIDATEKEIMADIAKWIEESNQRIQQNLKEIKRMEGLLKYGQMTMEDFRDAHPELALDPINRPTIFPHTPEYQPGPDDEKAATNH